MIGRTSGTVALFERFLDRPLLKYHCIIHQESVWKKIDLQHVMISALECVNKIKARGLCRREFREYFGLLDMQ